MSDVRAIVYGIMHLFGRSIAVIVCVLALFATGNAFADDGDIPRRLENGTSNFYESSVETTLAPTGSASDLIEENLLQLHPRVGIEILVEIPARAQAFSNEGLLAIYNILRTPSTMEGIEYYSASRDEMRVFYEESYAIADPGDTTRVADPIVSRIPDHDTVYAYQRDGSFGRNVQRLEYRQMQDGFLVLMENETTMVYKVIPLVSPGNLRTFLFVHPVPERGVIEFYGNLAVRVPAMFGLQERARNSFYNRIVALHDWFLGELATAGLSFSAP